MAKHETITYTCDNCNKKVRYNSSLNIVTSKREGSLWNRLCVKIERNHGFHNDGKVEQANLCQKCAAALLTNAAKRVRSGERASAGTENSIQEGWV